MGFGLHAGWAIEGAVGSLQKVDATYLSPHVNMAARLETSSKQYGVPLLASQVRYLRCMCLVVEIRLHNDASHRDNSH
jgi:class 3 adenylate cyclase